MLLAAGLGTRLRPWTETRPKCMVPVAGKPVLQYNSEWRRSQGVVEVVVNLHQHAQVVTGHFGGGGFFMLYCPIRRKGSVRKALAAVGLREMPYSFDFHGAKVMVNI